MPGPEVLGAGHAARKWRRVERGAAVGTRPRNGESAARNIPVPRMPVFQGITLPTTHARRDWVDLGRDYREGSSTVGSQSLIAPWVFVLIARVRRPWSMPAESL